METLAKAGQHEGRYKMHKNGDPGDEGALTAEISTIDFAGQ
jgi:hypothetical protein